MVLDPVYAYIDRHSVGLQLSAATLRWTWCAVGVVVFVLASLNRAIGARIG